MSRDYYSIAAAQHFETPATIAEINRLARRVRDGDRIALRKLTGHLASIAEAWAGKHHRMGNYRGLERDDLRQEAMRAMLESIDDWKPEKSAFRTHAYNMARFATLNLINSGNIVRVPKQYTQDAFVENPTSHAFKKLARHAQNAAKMAVLPAASLGPTLGEDEGLEARIGEAEGEYEEVLGRLALEQALRRARGLTERDRTVLAARFGLYGESPKLYGEIGEMVGVSEQRVRQICITALRKLSDANTTPATREMVS